MSNPLKGSPERQAVAAIAGFLYQIWQSVFSWITLEPSEVLYLEGAEDFDIIAPDQSIAVQVRHTSAPITLGTAKTITAIGQFWKLREMNPGKKMSFRYLTTSEPGVESGAPFGQGVPGMDVWEQCKRNRTGVELICTFLLTRTDLEGELRLFLETAAPEQIYRDLIQRIAWITGQHDSQDLQNPISDILICHGEQQGVSPSAATKVRARLFEEACDTVTRSRIEDRVLRRSNFLTIFEQATSVSVPRAELQLLQTAIVSMAPSFRQIADEISFIQGPMPTNSPPAVPNAALERTDLIASVKVSLESVDVFLLSGGAGIGKTTIAAYVARYWQPRTLWMQLRGLAPESISLGLRRLTAEISRNTDKCLVVLDDLDLLPISVERFEDQLASLLLTAREKGIPILLTSQRSFPQRLIRRFSLSAHNSLRVPAMNLGEIRNFCSQNGCPASEIHLISMQILARTSGHPTLVHALVINLVQKGWHETSDAHSTANSDVLQNERAEARQLLSKLSSTGLELLYRLTLIEDRFRKDHVLKIGEFEPSIAHPGDWFDQIVGPWVEPLAGNYFQISPLLLGEAEQIWSQAKCRVFHEAIADAVLTSAPRTIIEANTILRQAWKARSSKHLHRINAALAVADPDILQSAFGIMVWFAAISLNPGEVLFEEDQLLSGFLRSLQLRIAQQVHERLSEKVLDAWMYEADQRPSGQATFIERFLLAVSATILSSAPLAPGRLFTYLATIEEAETIHADLIDDWEQQIAMAPPDGPASKATSIFENAVILAVSWYNDVDQLDDLVRALLGAPDQIRSRILRVLTRFPMGSAVLIDRFWMHESDKTVPDWNRCLTVFKQALSSFASWNEHNLVDALIRALTIIVDEYLGRAEDALDQLRHVTAEYGRDSSLIRTARFAVLLHLGRMHDVLTVARDSIEVWASEFDALQIFDVMSLRSAAIAASQLREWRTAAEFFTHAHALAQKKEGHLALATGLRADLAVAAWYAGDAAACIQEFSTALETTEQLTANEATKSDAFRLRKLVGSCLLWIIRPYERKLSKDVCEPPPGACSKLDVAEELYKLPDSDPDMLWWMLSQIDYYLDAKSGIEQVVQQRLKQSRSPILPPMLAKQRIQRLLRNGTVDNLPEELIQYFNACLEVRSTLPELQSQSPQSADVSISSCFVANDSVMGIPLFVSALLRIAGSAESLQSTIAAWRQFFVVHPEFERLVGWIDLAEQQLAMDASRSEKVLIYGSADLWSQRMPAAINLAKLKTASAVQLLLGQAGIVQFLNTVPWFDDVGPAVAELFADGWRGQLGFRGQFSLPYLTIPDLRGACDLPNKNGLAKISQIITAASRAVNRPLATSLQEVVDKLTSRPHP
jgi:tetratricopeptide (TPR) repeat protein